MTLRDLIHILNTYEKFNVTLMESAYTTLLQKIRSHEITYSDLKKHAEYLLTTVCRDINSEKNTLAMSAVKVLLVCLQEFDFIKAFHSVITEALKKQANAYACMYISLYVLKCTHFLSEDPAFSVVSSLVHNNEEIQDCKDSVSIAAEVVQLLIRLEKIADQNLKASFSPWARYIFLALGSPDQEIRNQALELLEKYKEHLTNNESLSLFVAKAIQNELGQNLKNLYAKNTTFVLKALVLVVKTVGKELHSILKKMVAIIHPKIASPDKLMYFDTLEIMINCLVANNADVICQPNTVDLIMTCLKAKYNMTEEESVKKIHLFWLLVKALGSNISCLRNKIILPLLELCLEVNKKPGKLVSKCLTFEFLVRLLETNIYQDQNVSLERELENYKWSLEPLSQKIEWDMSPLSTMLNTFTQLLSLAKRDIDAVILVQISLQFAQRIKEHPNTKLVFSFLQCFAYLVDNKMLKEETFVLLAVSSSFIMLQALTSKKETTTEIVNILSNIYIQMFELTVSYNLVSLLFEHLTPSLVLMFQQSSSIEILLPSFTTTLSRIWNKICHCVSKVYGLSCSFHDLSILFPLMECTLQHAHRSIRKSAVSLWNNTFCHLSEDVYPDSLKLVLSKAFSTSCDLTNQDSACQTSDSEVVKKAKPETEAIDLVQFNLKTLKVSLTKLDQKACKDFVKMKDRKTIPSYKHEIVLDRKNARICIHESRTSTAAHGQNSTPTTASDQTSTPTTASDQTSTPTTASDQTSTPTTASDQTSTPTTASDQTSTTTALDQTSTPTTVLDETSTPANASDQTSTPTTASDQTSTPTTASNQTSTPTTVLDETSTPATALDQISTPTTASDQANTPTTALDQTSTPTTVSDQANTPTASNQTSTPTTVLDETSTPATALDQISASPTKSGQTSKITITSNQSNTPTASDEDDSPSLDKEKTAAHVIDNLLKEMLEGRLLDLTAESQSKKKKKEQHVDVCEERKVPKKEKNVDYEDTLPLKHEVKLQFLNSKELIDLSTFYSDLIMASVTGLEKKTFVFSSLPLSDLLKIATKLMKVLQMVEDEVLKRQQSQDMPPLKYEEIPLLTCEDLEMPVLKCERQESIFCYIET
ncbi:telomere-associated protein RIF1-like isoform X1, partial [Biomphalaria glabrata]